MSIARVARRTFGGGVEIVVVSVAGGVFLDTDIVEACHDVRLEAVCRVCNQRKRWDELFCVLGRRLEMTKCDVEDRQAVCHPER